MSEISKEFKDWACSFSGCDGGDPKADIWLCGIEHGYRGNEDEKKDYYEKELPKEINSGGVKLKDKYDWADSITYNYGWNFAKLYQAIHGKNVENYREVAKTGGELFKLNLYPIAFNHTGDNLWHEYGVNKVTGFDNKYLFNTWCFFNRFPAFTKYRIKHKPKLIICTGVDYLRDFLMCFGSNSNMGKLKRETLEPISSKNKYDRNYYHVKIDETLLVVIPFFSGRYGLNSNHLLQEMGKEIKKLMEG